MKTAVMTKLKNRHMKTVKVQVLKQNVNRLHLEAFFWLIYESNFKKHSWRLWPGTEASPQVHQIQLDGGSFDSSTAV